MFEALNSKSRYRSLTIRWGDGLQLPSGFTKAADASCCVFLLYPIKALLPGGTIREQTIDLVWASVYGENWQMGNEDGSRYVIVIPPKVSYPDRSFTNQIVADGRLQLPDQKADNLWFYQLDVSGEMIKLTNEEFLNKLDECQFPTTRP